MSNRFNLSSLPGIGALFNLQALGIGRKRFVITIGDEGAVLAHVVGQEVRRRVFAPAPNPEAAAALTETLASHPTTPIHLLIDVLEQHYREVDLPNVSVIDRPKVVKRKLALTFPEGNLTGALPLPAREDGKNEQRYMFVAAPLSDELRAWLALFARAANPIDSVALLPIEAVSMGMALQAGGDGGRQAKSARNWQLLLTHQRASGFRQTIMHHGRLVFTRLTPSLEADATTEELIENIEREFASTISYLRRLSVSEADRVALMVLAEPDVCAGLDPRRLRIRTLVSMTPFEAAEKLGLEEVADEQDGFSDILYAAWHAQRSAPTLAIDTPQMRRARLLMRVPRWATTAAVLLGLVGTGFAGTTWLSNRTIAASIEDRRDENRRLEAQREAIEREVGTLAVSPERVDAAISGYQTIRDETIRHERVLARIAAALQPNMMVQTIEVRHNGTITNFADQLEERLTATRGEPAPKESFASMTVRMNGPFRDRNEVLAAFDRFAARLRESLPDHTLTQVQAPFNAGDGRRLTGTAGTNLATDIDRLPDHATAQYRLVGPG